MFHIGEIWGQNITSTRPNSSSSLFTVFALRPSFYPPAYTFRTHLEPCLFVALTQPRIDWTKPTMKCLLSVLTCIAASNAYRLGDSVGVRVRCHSSSNGSANLEAYRHQLPR